MCIPSPGEFRPGESARIASTRTLICWHLHMGLRERTDSLHFIQPTDLPIISTIPEKNLSPLLAQRLSSCHCCAAQTPVGRRTSGAQWTRSGFAPFGESGLRLRQAFRWSARPKPRGVPGNRMLPARHESKISARGVVTAPHTSRPSGKTAPRGLYFAKTRTENPPREQGGAHEVR
jgi:hypothetical protein